MTVETSAAVKTLVVALVGNPNTGKTTLFNALTGLRHRVGNYPGVTVETKKGDANFAGQAVEIIDLPGTYSLAPRSPDEMVTVEILLGRQRTEQTPDLIVVIADASNLERNLYLASQVLDLGKPVILALNMIDVAKTEKLKIDVEQLRRRLNIPIVPIQANHGHGLEELKQAILETTQESPSEAPSSAAASPLTFPDEFDREVQHLLGLLSPDTPPFLVQRLLLDIGGFTEQQFAGHGSDDLGEQVQAARQRLATAGCPVTALEARVRYGWIRDVCADCMKRPPQRVSTWTDALDRLVLHRVWGSLIFLILMFLVFQSIFTFAAPLMDLIDAGNTWLSEWVRGVLPGGPLTSLLADGVIPGVGGVLIFLPQIMILFLFLAILEDCGYMARAAFLMDKLMSRCGLSGKSFIPMLSSFACAVPGIMAARVIENRRDRFATILVAPLMSCSARLPVYVLLIGAFLTSGFAWWVPGLVMFCMYLLGLVLAPLVAFALKSTLLRGAPPAFVMELPTYKMPSLQQVLRRMVDSGWIFIRRAGTLILASMIVVWALLYFPYTDANGDFYEDRVANAATPEQAGDITREWKKNSMLGYLGQAIEPVVRPLGWDWRIGVATLASFPAREVVVGTLGILFHERGEAEDDTGLSQGLQSATWPAQPDRKLFTIPTALSVMVFFALCCQCASTLAVIKRETNSWRWPVFTFVYMTVLAYVAALLVYQVGTLLIV